MPHEVTKKRKFDTDRSSSISGSFSRDVKELRSNLKQCDASTIIRSLSDTLDDIPPGHLQILKQILDPLFEADAKPKHCVRCHQSFYEAENTHDSCVVRCGSPENTGYPDEEYEQYYMMRTPCCKRLHSEVDLDDFESDDEELICYRAKHTTDTKTVKYYYGSDDEREEGLDHWGENGSVRTCRKMGCGGRREKSGRQLIGMSSQSKRRKRASTPLDSD
ncbi:hypothetical protein FRC10_005248 [Ceratobasidium sp. 414]|nr:hypothetical protein FRC10_005248 [Ceratobasidium sp. 414]